MLLQQSSEILTLILNDITLNQNKLCLVSKQIQDVVKDRAQKLVEISKNTLQNELLLLYDINENVPVFNYTTIYYDGAEWYIENASWPPNSIDF